MKNFWQKIPRPILALAPLAGFTDSAFRLLARKYGANVVYSEMASATALFYNSQETLKLLSFEKKERPYVVQLFGSDPEHFAVAAKIVCQKIKPDGIDINFGCPVKKVLKQKAGAALMANLKLSRQVIEAVLENSSVPVSVKIRTQSGKVSALDFLQNISDLPVAAVMIHGRSLSQGFAGPIDLAMIKEAKKIFPGIILANGGIEDLSGMKMVLKNTGVSGVGIGRGALGRPWLFKTLKGKTDNISGKAKQVFAVAIKHAELVQKQKGKRGIIEMRQHLAWYMRGLSGASQLREQLVKVESLRDIKKILS
ncbi:MAG TPA: tRNA-dihydrouridine synthase [bacterium]|mgnify:CR=1 FL=1|nr:tRNA-dihydrouridine synthase [bacterium]HPT29624.1 tRNA-dihydrouridine synthase [bacterium]